MWLCVCVSVKIDLARIPNSQIAFLLNAVNNFGELRVVFLSKQTKNASTHSGSKTSQKSVWYHTTLAREWLKQFFQRKKTRTFDTFLCLVVWAWISLRACTCNACACLFVCEWVWKPSTLKFNLFKCMLLSTNFLAVSPNRKLISFRCLFLRLEFDAWKKHSEFIWTKFVRFNHTHKFSRFNVIWRIQFQHSERGISRSKQWRTWHVRDYICFSLPSATSNEKNDPRSLQWIAFSMEPRAEQEFFWWMWMNRIYLNECCVHYYRSIPLTACDIPYRLLLLLLLPNTPKCVWFIS